MCAFFEFCDFTFLIGKKSNFKFEIFEILEKKKLIMSDLPTSKWESFCKMRKRGNLFTTYLPTPNPHHTLRFKPKAGSRVK